MSLQGQVTIVCGATGIVGNAIAQTFYKEGATVVCPLRPGGSTALPAELAVAAAAGDGRLSAPLFDYGSKAGAAALAAAVRAEHGAVDHVASAMGGMVELGPVTALSEAGFESAMRNRVQSHLVAAQALLPLLRPTPRSSYTVLTGGSGEALSRPDWALFSIANAACYGLVVALQAEVGDAGPRINELRVCAVVRRDGDAEHPQLPGLPAQPASLVADAAREIAAGAHSGVRKWRGPS